MTQLSKWITQEEFERSQVAVRRAIPNRMNNIQLGKAKNLCRQVLDPIRDHYDAGCNISSGFRNSQVNALVGGADDSQHKEGEAGDFTISGKSVEQVYSDIKAGHIKGANGKPLVYDQLIHEGSWVHISYREGHNRGEWYRAKFTGRGVTYTRN